MRVKAISRSVSPGNYLCAIGLQQQRLQASVSMQAFFSLSRLNIVNHHILLGTENLPYAPTTSTLSLER
jgi:hypothetical protein